MRCVAAGRGFRSCSSRLGGLGFAGAHQGLDLRARQRPAQVRQRPAGFEHDRRIFMHVVHQEHALAQAGEHLLHPRPIEFLAAFASPRLPVLRSGAACRARFAGGR